MNRSFSATRLMYILIFCVAFSLSVEANGGEGFSSTRQRLTREFEQSRGLLKAQWGAHEKFQQEAWEQLKREVEQKWQVFISSDRKNWVDYDENLSSRSRVDFENGVIEIETVVPAENPEAKEVANIAIAGQAKKLLGTKLSTDQPILQNQLKDQKGRPVTTGNIDGFIRDELLPRVQFDPQPYQARDHLKRKRYSVRLDLVPRHLDIRARQYLPQVTATAERFGLDPRLVMAVIHTESYFNSLAISTAGAIGLMQVIPRYAGQEAYQYLYGLDWKLPADYLHSPGINIELGTAYLHLLQGSYFAHIKDREKNLYLSICAYNWGPTAVSKKISGRHDPANMTDEELFDLLSRITPAETRDYLTKVTERIPLYSGYFGL